MVENYDVFDVAVLAKSLQLKKQKIIKLAGFGVRVVTVLIENH